MSLNLILNQLLVCVPIPPSPSLYCNKFVFCSKLSVDYRIPLLKHSFRREVARGIIYKVCNVFCLFVLLCIKGSLFWYTFYLATIQISLRSLVVGLNCFNISSYRLPLCYYSSCIVVKLGGWEIY